MKSHRGLIFMCNRDKLKQYASVRINFRDFRHTFSLTLLSGLRY
jgi:hypothetical protein